MMNVVVMLGFSAVALLLVLLIAAAASLPAVNHISTEIEPPHKEPST